MSPELDNLQNPKSIPVIVSTTPEKKPMQSKDKKILRVLLISKNGY